MLYLKMNGLQGVKSQLRFHLYMFNTQYILYIIFVIVENKLLQKEMFFLCDDRYFTK